MTERWMIYGATGYTGRALAEEAVRRGDSPILAGRRADAIRALADELGLESRAFSLADAAHNLRGVALVAHCAGPFSRTAQPMREACLSAGTHYLDITGEIPVFVDTHAADTRAREAGVCLMSGTGFDVVPSDCLALFLAEALPDATHLELAISGDGPLSPGTTKTMLENVHRGGCVRANGELQTVPAAWKDRAVPFSIGTRTAVSIPWGDVATAYFTTGIPNIVVYAAAPPKTVRMMRWSRPFHRLLAPSWVRRPLEKRIERKVHGPSEEQRANLRSHLWGEVRNASGQRVSATLDGPEGYQWTVLATLAIARRVLAGELAPGAWTPGRAFGADFVLGFPGVERSEPLRDRS